MGAVLFYIMFLALIPVAAIILEILSRLGIVTDLQDPPEWDLPEEERESENNEQSPQIILLPQSDQRKAI